MPVMGVPVPVRDLSDEALMDLLCVTSDEVGRGSLEMALDHNDYPFIDTILREDRLDLEGGTAITRRIRLDKSGQARWVDPWEPDDPRQVDTVYPFTMPWKYLQTQKTYERHQVLMNAGSDQQIYDFVELQEVSAMEDFCNELEGAAWSVPASPTEKAMWGVPTWICKAVDATGTGFFGGRPDGGTAWADVAGIAPCTSDDGTSSIAGGKARWRNYCAPYTAVNTTLLKTIRTAFKRIRFRAPPMISKAFEKGSPYENFRIYTNVDTSVLLEELAEKRGDRYGANLMLYEGAVVFNRVPIVGIDWLDADTSDPIYMVNRTFFKAIVLAGDYLRKSKIYNEANQHNVYRQYTDLTVQTGCTNRQRQAVINKV